VRAELMVAPDDPRPAGLLPFKRTGENLLSYLVYL